MLRRECGIPSPYALGHNGAENSGESALVRWNDKLLLSIAQSPPHHLARSATGRICAKCANEESSTVRRCVSWGTGRLSSGIRVQHNSLAVTPRAPLSHSLHQDAGTSPRVSHRAPSVEHSPSAYINGGSIAVHLFFPRLLFTTLPFPSLDFTELALLLPLLATLPGTAMPLAKRNPNRNCIPPLQPAGSDRA